MRFLISMFMLSILLVSALPADHHEGKIPITTQSEEALKLYLKGRDLAERLRGQESIQYFQKAIQLDPDFAMAHLNLAFVQPSAKEFFASLNRAKALTDQISKGEVSWIMGVDAGVNGFPMKQRQYYQSLVEMYPQDERAHNLLGTHNFGQQEWEKAIAEYKKAIAINPDFSQPYNQMGYAYRFLSNYDEAENAFKKYIELIPDDPNPYDSYAELLMKKGNYEASIEQYRNALDIDPNFVASHIGIATNLNFLGKHQKAREQLDQLYKIARNDGERRAALFAMSVSYVDEGKYDEAMESLNKQYQIAEKINDTAAMAGDLVAMGNIQFETGAYDKAMQMFEKANQTMQNSDHKAEIKENAHRNFLYNSARVAIMKGDMDTAAAKATAFEEAAAAIQNQFQIWLSHQVNGMIAMHQKNYDTAIKEFEQANQQNPYTFYRIAECYSALGEKEKARTFYKKAANHNTLNSMQYAFIRNNAENKLTAM